MECDGERGVKFLSVERAGGAVDDAVDGGAKGPADDSGDSDVVAEGDGEENRVTVGKGVR